MTSNNFNIGLVPLSGYSNIGETVGLELDITALEAQIRQQQTTIAAGEQQMTSLDRTLDDWRRMIQVDSEKIRTLEDQKALLLKEIDYLVRVRYQKWSTLAEKGKQRYGEFCKNIIGYDNSCLDTNTAKRTQKKTEADRLATEIATLTKRVTDNRDKILQTEREMVGIRERVNAAQAALNDSLSRLANAKGANDPEVLQKQAELESMKQALLDLQAKSEIRKELVEQETASLEASIGMKQATMPMIIGFALLVGLALMYKYFFQGKTA